MLQVLQLSKTAAKVQLLNIYRVCLIGLHYYHHLPLSVKMRAHLPDQVHLLLGGWYGRSRVVAVKKVSPITTIRSIVLVPPTYIIPHTLTMPSTR